LSARVPDWLEDERIVLHPSGEIVGLGDVQIASPPEHCLNEWVSETDAARYQPLGKLPLGHHRIAFRLEAWTEDAWRKHDRPRIGRPWYADHYASDEQRKAADAALAALEPRPLSTSTLALEVEIVPTIDDAIPPVSTPELDRAVAQALSVAFEDQDGTRSAEFVLHDEPAL